MEQQPTSAELRERIERAALLQLDARLAREEVDADVLVDLLKTLRTPDGVASNLAAR